MGLFDEQEASVDDDDAGDAYDRGRRGREAAQRIGQAEAFEELDQGRRLLDADHLGAGREEMLQAGLVVGCRGDDRGHIAADRAAQYPEQAADDADCRRQGHRTRQAQVCHARLLESVRQGIDHVPEGQAQDDRHQQAASRDQQVNRGRNHDCPQGGTLETHARTILSEATTGE